LTINRNKKIIARRIRRTGRCLMRFTISRKAYELTREGVEKAMASVQPETARLYFFVINGKKYPPKQVLSVTLGLSKVEFTTAIATSILQRLGFKLQRY
jgi:hypothetical protein